MQKIFPWKISITIFQAKFCQFVIIHVLSCSAIEDYAVVYFGSAFFKILRLLFIAVFSVHLFACIFFKVKESSATSQDDVLDFYMSRNIAENVHFALYLVLTFGHDVN
jgi:hypothetical protein